MKVLLAILVLLVQVLIHYCSGDHYPFVCNGLGGDPDQITDGFTIMPDCSVPHFKLKWTQTIMDVAYIKFEPEYRCTLNSTNSTNFTILETHPNMSIHNIPTVTGTISKPTVQFPLGANCTFGGCIGYFDGSYDIYYVQTNSCVIDIDECLSGEANCDSNNSDCENIVGSFRCHCRPGYSGNGTYCDDVDECKQGIHNCSSRAECLNLDGNYSCSCNLGFTGDGFNCTNVNECETSDNPCGPANCSDNEGSFECLCPSGYTWTRSDCRDIDECLTGHDCHDNAECTNEEGGYSCSCKTGFTGDGFNCGLGPLIGTFGIAFPAFLILAGFTSSITACWVVARRRKRAGMYGYLDRFFPWSDPLNPDFVPVDVEMKLCYSPSITSTFNKLLPPENHDDNTSDTRSVTDNRLLSAPTKGADCPPSSADLDKIVNGQLSTESTSGSIHDLNSPEISSQSSDHDDGVCHTTSGSSPGTRVTRGTTLVGTDCTMGGGYVGQDTMADPPTACEDSDPVLVLQVDYEEDDQRTAKSSDAGTASGYISQSLVYHCSSVPRRQLENSQFQSVSTDSGYIQTSEVGGELLPIPFEEEVVFELGSIDSTTQPECNNGYILNATSCQTSEPTSCNAIPLLTAPQSCEEPGGEIVRMETGEDDGYLDTFPQHTVVPTNSGTIPNGTDVVKSVTERGHSPNARLPSQPSQVESQVNGYSGSETTLPTADCPDVSTWNRLDIPTYQVDGRVTVTMDGYITT